MSDLTQTAAQWFPTPEGGPGKSKHKGNYIYGEVVAIGKTHVRNHASQAVNTITIKIRRASKGSQELVGSTYTFPASIKKHSNPPSKGSFILAKISGGLEVEESKHSGNGFVVYLTGIIPAPQI